MFNLNRAELQYCYNLLKVLRSGVRSGADFPLLMEIQTVNRCSAHCAVCPYPYTIAKQPYHEMSEAMYERILQELKDEDAFQVMVFSFQNEPFVDAHLLEKARRFKELMPNKRLEVVTNGSRITADQLPEIYRHFDLVSVSVNGHSKEVYEEVMAGLHWEKIQDVLGAITENPEYREKTILRFIRQKENAAEYHAFKRYWNRRGFRVFGFDINNRVGSVRNFDALKIADTASRKVQGLALKTLSRMLVPTCPIPFITTYIRSNGDAVLCFNDYTEEHILGNLREHSIREIFNSPTYQQVRSDARAGRILTNEPCRNCNLYREGIWLTV